VPWAYKEKGAYEGKKDRNRAYKGKNECKRPLKFFWLRKYQKVPRAYENLTPALFLA
jgi:hypothetical protein